MVSIAELAARHEGHDMGGMGMASSTMSGMASMATGTMGSMNGTTSAKSGGMSMGGSCKISMLWNWNTVDSCFLAKSWHNNTKAKFAGSVIGVFFVCLLIEALRRAAREYDRKITAANVAEKGPIAGWQPTMGQQVVRAVFYGVQFTAAFLVMLLGMYYNGYILFAIFLGHTIGYFTFGRDTCGVGHVAGKTDSGCAC